MMCLYCTHMDVSILAAIPFPGSKSSLAIYLEQPAEQASTSDSGITSSSANNSSSRPIGQLPLSSFLQTDGSRLRTPMQLNNAAGSGSTARAGALWKVGNVMWERAADWAVVVVALIVLAASEKEPPRASESEHTSAQLDIAKADTPSVSSCCGSAGVGIFQAGPQQAVGFATTPVVNSLLCSGSGLKLC